MPPPDVIPHCLDFFDAKCSHVREPGLEEFNELRADFACMNARRLAHDVRLDAPCRPIFVSWKYHHNTAARCTEDKSFERFIFVYADGFRAAERSMLLYEFDELTIRHAATV